MMNNIEEKEIYEINNKKYIVITKMSEKSLNKEKLEKIICNYAMKELNQEE